MQNQNKIRQAPMGRRSVRTPMAGLQNGRELEHLRTGAPEDWSVPGLEQPRAAPTSRTSTAATKVVKHRGPAQPRIRSRGPEWTKARIREGPIRGFPSRGEPSRGVRSEDFNPGGSDPGGPTRGGQGEGGPAKGVRAERIHRSGCAQHRAAEPSSRAQN